MSKNNKIPPYILCPTPDLARRVLEKIERESDLRLMPIGKKQLLYDCSYYPETVIRTVELDCCGSPIDYANKSFYESKGITNFTKAEDYLLCKDWPPYEIWTESPVRKESFFGKIDFKQLDIKLDKLINDMTNKTWETLSEGDYLLDVDNSDRKVLEVIRHLVALKTVCEDSGDVEWFSKDFLIDLGFKIKGASEEKPSIQSVIELLERTDYAILSFGKITDIKKAIEMLKKLK